MSTLPASEAVRENKAKQKSKGIKAGTNPKEILAMVTINKSPQEVFAFWRDFKNMSAFMTDIAEVRATTGNRARWRSGKAEWETEITTDVTDRQLSWQSVQDSRVRQEGTVWVRPAAGNRGTVVELSLHYETTGGILQDWLSKFWGEDKSTIVQKNLRRFKALMETGEIPTVEGQPSGRQPEAGSDLPRH